MKPLALLARMGISAALAVSAGTRPARASYAQCLNEIATGPNRWSVLRTPLAEQTFCQCMVNIKSQRLLKNEDMHYCVGAAHAMELAEKYYSNSRSTTNRYDVLREMLRSNPYGNAIMKAPNISF